MIRIKRHKDEFRPGDDTDADESSAISAVVVGLFGVLRRIVELV